MRPREQWRPIPGHGQYEASDRGRIRNARTRRVLKPMLTRRGYLKVDLGSRARNREIHRLVCLTWHGPPPVETDHADHIDFDRTNNAAENLRWLRAHLNIGRQLRYGPRGWELLGDEEAPDDHVPLSDDERAALDDRIAAAGW